MHKTQEQINEQDEIVCLQFCWR